MQVRCENLTGTLDLKEMMVTPHIKVGAASFQRGNDTIQGWSCVPASKVCTFSDALEVGAMLPWLGQLLCTPAETCGIMRLKEQHITALFSCSVINHGVPPSPVLCCI